jgi:hypothetical protein
MNIYKSCESVVEDSLIYIRHCEPLAVKQSSWNVLLWIASGKPSQ